ncbi:MAG TPA: zinc dependent phospholipase C family protein [Agriterribacter sp.]|nr:zinc dependent phospholipase C family protein [Agriterribacter sp.]HRQ49429.1 zinc dependent phospholipase C family protein [Agriterribacter sp.]
MHPKLLLLACSAVICQHAFCWGFYAHKKINHHAVFLLPPAMMAFYKPHIDFITEHAVDPDKRRYIVTAEAPRHYIDLNRYGAYPFNDLPRAWISAVEKYGEDSLMAHGIVPWWIDIMHQRLTRAFREKNHSAILKLSTEIGHYIADAHVPLHAHSNYNGQQTGQQGIHGFWESRIPELLAETAFDYFIGKAQYISSPQQFMWQRVLESAAAADTVLSVEKRLTQQFPPALKYAFEARNGIIIRQYSSAFTIAYDKGLQGMVERRMRQSVFAVASFWYTAWINAGQPGLHPQADAHFSETDKNDSDALDRLWKTADSKGRTCGN